jgi:hypothetical protein
MARPPALEIVEIDRRQFLRIAGGGLISLTALGLIGCGGHGYNGRSNGAGGGESLTTVKGTVQLPAGVSSKLGSITASNVFQTQPVGSNLQFSLGVLGPTPSLAYVFDASDRVVFIGFLDPASSSNVLGPTSTAVALLFFALGGFALPGENIAAVISLIATEPATAALAQVVSQRVAANPYAIDGLDPQVAAALKTALTEIAGTSSALGQEKAVIRASDPPSTQLLITGSNPQSGFSVNQDPTSVGFIGQNNFRRYAKVYLYETATVDQAGVKTVLTQAKLIGSPIEVSSTVRLNLITALKGAINGTAPFAPVNTSTVPLSLVENTTQTLYDVVVVGSSSNSVEPSFFAESQYSGAVAGWRQDIQTLNLRSCFADVVFGLFLNFLGVAAVGALPTTTVDQAIADLTGGVKSVAFNQAVAQAAQAANPELIIGTTGQIVVDNGVASFAADRVFIYGVANFLATAAGQQAINVARTGTLISVGFRVILGLASAATAFLAFGDLGAVLHDLSSSDRGDIWNASVLASSLTLTPMAPSAAAGSTVTFSVKLHAGYVPPPNTTVVYDWSQTGGLAIITDNHGISGASSIETTSNTVGLIITPSQQAPITVAVTAYSMRPGGIKTLIDTASTVVTVTTLPTTIAPALLLVQCEIAKVSDILSAFVTFKPVSGAASSTEYTFKAPPIFGNVTYGTTFQQDITDGSLPIFNAANDINLQIQNAPGGAFNMGGGLVGFFSGYVEYAATLNQTTPDLAQAEAYLTSTFTNPPPIKVIYPS